MVGILSIQFNPKVGDKETNLKKVDSFINQNSDKKLDLIVLPEFFSTGTMDHGLYKDIAENEEGGIAINGIKEIAKKYNTNIVAGTIVEKVANEKCGDRFYNTSFVVDRNGKIVGKSRKIHLFKYLFGKEDEITTPGDRPAVVDLDFGKVGINICYDIMFPVHIKNLVKMGAEIIAFPSAWFVRKDKYDDIKRLNAEKDLFKSLQRVRAFENFTCIVSSNQFGKTDEDRYNIGCSMISAIPEYEDEISVKADDKECTIYADIDLDLVVRKYKKEFPISIID